MLEAIGVDSVDELFAGIGPSVRLNHTLDLPPALTERELRTRFEALADRNRTHAVAFLGAGTYPHHIPALVGALAGRSEFYTAYTPYQPEVAQGTLQAIFEFQTYMAELTGMDVANASLYDGSTAVAEGVLMACRISPQRRFLVTRTIHPEYRMILETYARRLGLEFVDLDFDADGRLDPQTVQDAMTDDVAEVVVQSPNFFGTVEPVAEIASRAHAEGALAIVNVAEALSLGILRSPGNPDSPASGADIVVGEAQSLGVPMNFGGPHVGFVASHQKYVRQLPGRLVGMGRDAAGSRAFVLTLATREQHIRREKATSNICTNQSLCALMTTVYLATLGPSGLRDVAVRNLQKAAWVRDRIRSETPHRVLFDDGPRFNEFVVRLDQPERVYQSLREHGVAAGFPLGHFYPELDDCLLVCATETHSAADVDRLINALTPQTVETGR